MGKKPVYKRVLLKVSGEALRGRSGFGIDPKVVEAIARQIKEIRHLGIEIAIVIGGGNLFRGQSASQEGMDRVTADYMGMLATVINALAMQDALERINVPTRVLSAIEMKAVSEPYIRRRALRHLEKSRVIILAGGTGNPYFTTDTTAALRATEIKAQALLKATKVDGVYSSDPMKDKSAKKYTKLDYMTILKKSLKIMDSTAASLCMDNNIPIIVFSLQRAGNIKRIIMGERVGTIVTRGR